jgi:hypothetical protein
MKASEAPHQERDTIGRILLAILERAFATQVPAQDCPLSAGQVLHLH